MFKCRFWSFNQMLWFDSSIRYGPQMCMILDMVLKYKWLPGLQICMVSWSSNMHGSLVLKYACFPGPQICMFPRSLNTHGSLVLKYAWYPGPQICMFPCSSNMHVSLVLKYASFPGPQICIVPWSSMNKLHILKCKFTTVILYFTISPSRGIGIVFTYNIVF